MQGRCTTSLYHCSLLEARVEGGQGCVEGDEGGGGGEGEDGRGRSPEVEARWEREEERRKLEKEGYEVDIRGLRGKARDLEELGHTIELGAKERTD